jgi:hypothetical protein
MSIPAFDESFETHLLYTDELKFGGGGTLSIIVPELVAWLKKTEGSVRFFRKYKP